MLKKLIDYLVNDLGVERDTAVTVILTLLTFACGYLITGIIKFIARWKKQTNYKRTLKIIIEDFLSLCEKQSKVFEQFSTEKGLIEGSNFNIKVVPNFNQNYLSGIDVSIFIENFSLFFNKGRARQISSFFEIVESVKYSKVALKETIGMALSSYQKSLVVYNQNLHNLERLKDSIPANLNGVQVDSALDPYINAIYDPFIQWTKNGKISHIKTTYTEIVRPTLENYRVLTPTPLSHEAITYCLLCDGAYIDISNAENLIKEQVAESAITYKKAFENGSRLAKDW